MEATKTSRRNMQVKREKNNQVNIKHRISVILIMVQVILVVLSGCGGNAWNGLGEVEVYSRTLQNCTQYELQEQKTISLAYDTCKEVHFPSGYVGSYFKYPYWEEPGKAYHVVTFQGNKDLPIAFEWIGDSTLGTYIHEIEELQGSNYIELTDSTGKAKLFAAKETYEDGALDASNQVAWKDYIRTDVKVVEKSKAETTSHAKGYQIVQEVRENAGQGYAVIFVDTIQKTITQLVYTESKDIFDSQRVEALVGSLQLSDGIVTQTKHDVSVEVGNVITFFPDEYFEGNPYELSQYIWEQEGEVWTQTGSFMTTIGYGEEIFSLQVNVVDTTPPSFELDELSGIVVEGQTIELDEFVKVKKVKDASKPVTISYAGFEDSVTVGEEHCNENGVIPITVYIEDAAGNVAEGQTKLLFVERNEETAWVEQIGWDVGTYWELVFAEYMLDESLTIEAAALRAEQEWGLDTAKEGVKLADSQVISISYQKEHTDNMEAFYTGLSYIPEELLQRFAKEGWTLQVMGDEITNAITGGISAGDTWYDEKLIRYSTASIQETVTIPHEFGHFVDVTLGWVSNQQEFLAMYQTRLANRGLHVTEYYDAYTTKDADGIYDGYSYSDVREFYADSFACYLMEPEKLQNTYPEIYAYLDACVALIDGE